MRKAVRSFEVLKDVWAKDIGINLTTMVAWADFETLRQLRHVLVHRLGRWEPGLDPKKDLEARLLRLGVDPGLYRGQIPLNSGDLNAAIRQTIDLIDEVDPQS
jgi:hypothetical protein